MITKKTPVQLAPVDDIQKNTIAFSVLLEAKNCNPNGNPDSNNDPRTNMWGYGQITDVCFKRMVRNAALMLANGDTSQLFMLKNSTIVADNEEIFNKVGVKPTDKIDPKDQVAVQKHLCEQYIDVRWFGGMLDAKKDKDKKERYNAGQLKGAVQICFGESIDPVYIVNNAITRSKKTNDDRDKGNSSEMGQKAMVDFGLYRIDGVISPHNAKYTYLKPEDVRHFFRCLLSITNANLTASKIGLRLRRTDIWLFDNCVCNYHAAFDTLKINPLYNGNGETKYARCFEDYEGKIQLNDQAIKKLGVTHHLLSNESELSQIKFSA